MAQAATAADPRKIVTAAHFGRGGPAMLAGARDGPRRRSRGPMGLAINIFVIDYIFIPRPTEA